VFGSWFPEAYMPCYFCHWLDRPLSVLCYILGGSLQAFLFVINYGWVSIDVCAVLVRVSQHWFHFNGNPSFFNILVFCLDCPYHFLLVLNFGFNYWISCLIRYIHSKLQIPFKILCYILYT
jgi:hypothetical protein